VNIISDQGTQFESTLFTSMLGRLGIKRQRTTAFHPQSNGAVERAHRTLKQCLRAIDGRDDWERALPQVLFAMRTSVSEATQFPPSLLVFGGEVRSPADFLAPPNDNQEKIAENDFFQRLWADVQEVISHANKNQHERPTPSITKLPQWVWLRQPPGFHASLKAPYSGPFEVIKQEGTVVTISINGKPSRVNIDRLKPASMASGNGSSQRKYLCQIHHHQRNHQYQWQSPSPNYQCRHPHQSHILFLHPLPQRSQDMGAASPFDTEGHVLFSLPRRPLLEGGGILCGVIDASSFLSILFIDSSISLFSFLTLVLRIHNS
jgi:hypothetical protein